MCEKLELIDNILKAEKLFSGLKLSTVRKYRDYYYTVDAYVSQGAKKSEAITWAADDFGVSENSIYRGVGFFRLPKDCSSDIQNAL